MKTGAVHKPVNVKIRVSGDTLFAGLALPALGLLSPRVGPANG